MGGRSVLVLEATAVLLAPAWVGLAREGSGRAVFGVAEMGDAAVLAVGGSGGAGLGWRERVDRVKRRLEEVGVPVAVGEPEDDPSAGADDPRGDVEQESPERVGVTA